MTNARNVTRFSFRLRARRRRSRRASETTPKDRRNSSASSSVPSSSSSSDDEALALALALASVPASGGRARDERAVRSAAAASFSRNAFGSAKSVSRIFEPSRYASHTFLVSKRIDSGNPIVWTSASHCACSRRCRPSQYATTRPSAARDSSEVAETRRCASSRDPGPAGVAPYVPSRGPAPRAAPSASPRRPGVRTRLAPRAIPAPAVLNWSSSSSTSRTTSCDCVPHRWHT